MINSRQGEGEGFAYPESAVLGEGDFCDSVEFQPDIRGVGVRFNDEIEFELLARAVINDVDSRIDFREC